MVDSRAIESVPEFYDKFSDYYHLIYRDWGAIVRSESATIDSLLRRYSPEHRSSHDYRVLDCAAGIGTQSIGLWRLGYNVIASDISNSSLSLINRHAKSLCCDSSNRGPIEVLKQDFRNLSESFERNSFDAVICMDNSIAHMLTKSDVKSAVNSMASVLDQQGVILLSVRPYDDLLEMRPNIYPASPKFSGERIYFQVWRWTGPDAYVSHFFLILDDGRTMTWSTRFRAVSRQEIVSAFEEAGFEVSYLSPDECGYFQPVVVARRLQ